MGTVRSTRNSGYREYLIYMDFEFLERRRNLKFWRTPLDHDQIITPHGQIAVISTRCKGCGWCEAYCPRQVLKMSTVFNAKGYYTPEIVDEPRCVACGLCQIMCPEFAIYVTELEA